MQNAMMIQQRKLIAKEIYLRRIKIEKEYDLDMKGDADSDWGLAGCAMEHFEKPYKDKEWCFDEEDYGEFRKVFTGKYQEYLDQIKREWKND